MRIRSTSVAVLATVPLALAGCSQGAEQAPPAPAQAAPAPAQDNGVAWAGQLCGLVGGFSAAQQQAPGVNKTNAQTFKDSSIQQMTSAEKSANDTLNGLNGLGPAPIQGADQVTGTFANGFTQVRDVLQGARGKAEQVDTSDQQKFVQGMTGVQEELKKGQGINFDAQFAEFDKNKALNEAAGKAPQCQALMSPPQQQGQQQAPQQQAPQQPPR